MRLKALHIQGFKSFPERITLTFPKPLTGVVGPNGSGKSNVVDAVRWVLGENNPRRLRAAAPSDLIFHGGDKAKAVGVAEVSITLENLSGRLTGRFADLDEVTVTRRLFQDGRTENFINRAPCRLKDIREIFLDTGLGTHAYSIIEQGQIAFLLDSQPSDRRILIEEAAGVLKYRERKNEALRKLERAAANLERVEDIAGELERQSRSLKRQARRAGGYKTLMDRHREVDLLCRALRVSRLETDREKLAGELSSLQERRAALGARLSAREGDLESLRIRKTEREKTLAALREEVSRTEADINRLESERKHLLDSADDGERRLNFLVGEKDASANRIEGIETRRVEAARQLTDMDRQVSDLKQELESLEAQIQKAVLGEEKAEAEYRARNQAIFDGQSRITETNNQMAILNLHHDQADRRIDRLKAENEAVARETEQARSAMEKNRRSREKMAAEIEELRKNLAGGEEKFSKKEALKAKVEGRIRDLETEKARLLSRREVLTEALGRELEPGQKVRPGGEGSNGGIKGRIFDLIEVEAGYETAVGVALGEVIRGLAVETFDQCLDLLEKGNGDGGRMILCPIDGWLKDASSSDSPTLAGTLGWAADFIKACSYRQVFQRLLTGTAVVESVAEAPALFSRHSSLKRLVTKSGEAVDKSGILEGGPVSGAAVAVQRKVDLTKVDRSAAAAAADLEKAGRELTALDQELAAVREMIKTLRNEIETKERDLLRLSEEDRHHQKEASRLEGVIEGIKAEIEDTIREKEELRSRAETLKAEIEALEQEKGRCGSDREEAGRRLESARRGREELMLRKSRIEADLQGINERHKEIADKVDDLERMKAEMQEGFSSLGREEEEIRERVTRSRDRAAALVDKIVAVQEKAESLNRELLAKESVQEKDDRSPILEGEIRSLKSQLSSLEEEIQNLRVSAAGTEKELQLVAENLYTDYGMERPDLPAPEGDEEELHRELIDLQRRKDHYGPVNEEALQEFESVEGRRSFIDGQRQDLEESISSLKKAIVHINQISREKLLETFQAVRDRFAELIPLLFKGGTGDIILTGDDDILEAGVDMLVTPPGKRVRHLAQLSGGEKALVSLAYLMAIYLIRPTPFCLLDEVDAPFDDPNIERILTLIDNLKKDSQFILITHNKLTMEAADILYGVAMEKGVSRMVSVQLEGVPEAGRVEVAQ